MKRLGSSARTALAGGIAALWVAVTIVGGATKAQAGVPVPQTRLLAQESLGEKARRIRAQRENAQAMQSTDGKKQMSPAAADLTATVGLVQETDPEKYQEGVRLMLEQERFRVLDDVAAGE